jgi:hypothetical protein
LGFFDPVYELILKILRASPEAQISENLRDFSNIVQSIMRRNWVKYEFGVAMDKEPMLGQWR